MCATSSSFPSSSSSVRIPQQPGTDSLGVQVNQGPLCVAGQLVGAQDRRGKSSRCRRGRWDQKVHLASCPGVISAARLLNCLPGHKLGGSHSSKNKSKKKPQQPLIVCALAEEASIDSAVTKHQWQNRSVSRCPHVLESTGIVYVEAPGCPQFLMSRVGSSDKGRSWTGQVSNGKQTKTEETADKI